MSLKSQVLRPLPPEIAAWGAKVLALDQPYRRIGDVVYPELYPQFVDALAAISAPADLTAVDLAFVLAFGQHEHLSLGEAAQQLCTRIDWKYALHLPLDHAGCTGRDLKTFAKRVELAQLLVSQSVRSIAEAVEQCFADH